jgi:hypothetical protein
MLRFLFRLPVYVALVVLALGLYAWFGYGRRISPESLEASVAREVSPSDGGRPCGRLGEGRWRCDVGNGSGGPNVYRVRIDGHCWTAEHAGGPPRDRARGCVGLIDQVFP